MLRKKFKNKKNYFKMPSKIGLKKFNIVFKLKILESSGDTGRHQNRSNFDKFRKILKQMYLDRK